MQNKRIIYGRNNANGGGHRGRPNGSAQTQPQNTSEHNENGGSEGSEGRCHHRCGDLKAPFCETVTLHESLDASNITPASIRIAYDTDFLGYTLEELSMDAKLPCGGSCPIDVLRVTLTGAIPFIISAGPVTSGCGAGTALSCQGVCMVDEFIGYLCNDEEPDLESLGCASVSPTVDIDVEKCECTKNTNVTFHGAFTFSNLPTTLS
jgi:hypothetical protein